MFVDKAGLAVLAAAFVLILPASAPAQQFGLKAGINFASYPPQEDEHPDIPPRLGPVGGIWVRFAPARFSVQAEALFSEKGTHWHYSPNTRFEFRVRYIELPLLARADVAGGNSTTRIFVLGGAAPAFAVSARGTFELLGERTTADIGRITAPFDLGLVGALGFEVGGAHVEGRYTHGLLRVNTDNDDRRNNRVFSVTLGVRLR